MLQVPNVDSGVDCQMVHEINEGHHHDARNAPAETPSADEVVQSVPKLLSDAIEELGVPLVNFIEVLPFLSDLR